MPTGYTSCTGSGTPPVPDRALACVAPVTDNEPMRAVLRGADVVDGTGVPARREDVAIEGGHIVAVGRDLPSDAVEVDLTGLVLSPGFIDPHTHYDAQIFWDADLTPSSWHGVTTVVTGNCGFTLAPTKPEHREVIVKTLEQVEGMSASALEAGLTWSFETFSEYLGQIDRRPKRLNMACMVGHTALRWYVLGDDAWEREATSDEVGRMQGLLGEAIESGAIGFSTSRHTHVGAFGRPVPSRAASHEELMQLARTVGESGRGAMEIAIGGSFGIEDVVRMSAVSGRPVTWSGSVLVPSAGENGAAAAADAVQASTSPGAAVFPQFPCRPIVNQVCLRDPFPLRSASDGFLELLQADADERTNLYRDGGWRQRTREGLQPAWKQRLAEATVQETRVHAGIRDGPTLAELADREGSTPFDLLIDLSLADGLETRFRVATANTDESVIAQLLRDPRCLLGLSDAGAHVSQLCDADYASHLLGYWVREQRALPLELAVWRLTAHPAAFYGLNDRGRIAVGCAADLVAFDPASIGSGEVERLWDFPGGTDRLVARSTGIEFVWVNGVLTRSHGADLVGAAPGRLVTLR
jgi:N-acyl-D-amino-acid deacylase